MLSMLDPSNFTLTPNGGGAKTPGRGASPTPGSPAAAATSAGSSGGGGGGGARYVVQDTRWRFHGEENFPKPRAFAGGPRRYRAGRGSSVPLDLGAL
jgi:hypothetical protein